MADEKGRRFTKGLTELANEVGVGVDIVSRAGFPVSAYNLEATTVKERGILGIAYCVDNLQSVDLSGSSQTDAYGKKTWRLSENMCFPSVEIAYRLADPLSFVATPVTDRPTYLTVSPKFQTSPKDLVVVVYSWDKSGASSPNVAFCWRCRLRYDYKPTPVVVQ